VVELLREKMVAMAAVMVAGEVSCGCRGCARFVVDARYTSEVAERSRGRFARSCDGSSVAAAWWS